MVEHRPLQLGRDIAPGVLQQMQEIPGGMGLERVLEVQQPDAGHALALGQPEQILGVVVAVGEDAGACLATHPDRRPECVPLGHGVGGELRKADQLRPPFQEGVLLLLPRR